MEEPARTEKICTFAIVPKAPLESIVKSTLTTVKAILVTMGPVLTKSMAMNVPVSLVTLEPCVTSTSMNVPLTLVTMEELVLMESTASPVSVLKDTTIPHVSPKSTSASVIPVSMATVKTGSMVINVFVTLVGLGKTVTSIIMNVNQTRA